LGQSETPRTREAREKKNALRKRQAAIGRQAKGTK